MCTWITVALSAISFQKFMRRWTSTQDFERDRLSLHEMAELWRFGRHLSTLEEDWPTEFINPFFLKPPGLERQGNVGKNLLLPDFLAAEGKVNDSKPQKRKTSVS